jgi:hypothetical protein
VTRLIILCVAVCLGTIGGVFGATKWKARASEGADAAAPKVQILKTRMVSVPVLADGQVLGYVVTRLQFSADSDLLKTISVQPEAFVSDEAFKFIYETTPDDMKSGRKQVLRILTGNVAEGVNKRLGMNLIKDVVIDSWTYLSKQDMMRNNERARQ